MAKRSCARYPRCRNFVEGAGACADCKAATPPQEKPWKKLYGWKWQQYAKRFLREHPVCGGYPEGLHGEVIVATTDVDHIVPHRGDGQLFWAAANHQALCHTCHSRKTATEDGGFRGVAFSRSKGMRVAKSLI